MDIQQKQSFQVREKNAPEKWKESTTHTECTLHQLSPFIGKLKSSIACDLIKEFTRKGDLIVDPFAGSGTISLEAVINGRRSFASDVSIYSEVLTKGK